MDGEVTDARGVEISSGDTVIYGFGVGRSVAMCEGVVLGEPVMERNVNVDTKVSLTKSGRVRLRVVRRSYGGGEKPVVDIAPDRLVVLKPGLNNQEELDPDCPTLPPSPLPTQDEANAAEIEKQIKRYTARLRALSNGETLTEWEARNAALYYPREDPVQHWISWYAGRLDRDRAKLMEIETRTE
jgi:hypothetical protein